jgi:Transketolase, thiamine diphosphate binding domain
LAWASNRSIGSEGLRRGLGCTQPTWLLFKASDVTALLAGSGFRLGWDRFVVSPGHYIIAVYAIGAELGLIDPSLLATYGADGSLLEAIGTERTPIVDLTCGSLGQGLSGAIGFAIAARLSGEDRRIRCEDRARIRHGE